MSKNYPQTTTGYTYSICFESDQSRDPNTWPN